MSNDKAYGTFQGANYDQSKAAVRKPRELPPDIVNVKIGSSVSFDAEQLASAIMQCANRQFAKVFRAPAQMDMREAKMDSYNTDTAVYKGSQLSYTEKPIGNQQHALSSMRGHLSSGDNIVDAQRLSEYKSQSYSKKENDYD